MDRALSYIETRSPQGAVHVRDRILALVTLLQEQPRAGRPTSRRGVRRLSANRIPT
ncbi:MULTISPECIES: hypothetical protein [Bradyrhizobium]|uniref:hypothetical protein n=1 Tax=Bradyrhizobium TaxID=374 RepID=UPI0030B99068